MQTPSSADAAAARVLNPRGRWTIDPQRYAVVGEEGLRRAEGRMTELRDLLRANGVGLSLVVYPWPAQIAGRDLDSLQVRFWKAWSARHGVRFLDLFPVFVDGRDPGRVLDELFIDEDVHWNARGHAKVADALAPWLAAVRR